MRNYRASLAKWQTADPLGYPDGWNALAYCDNGVTGAVDLWGCKTEKIINFDTDQRIWVVIPWFNSEWDGFGQLKKLAEEAAKAGKGLKDYIDSKVMKWKRDKVREASEESLLKAVVKFFSEKQFGEYSEEEPPEWADILSQYEGSGWSLVYGPKHMGISIDYDDDIVNAGVVALIVEGCTHHWQAKFIKE